MNDPDTNNAAHESSEGNETNVEVHVSLPPIFAPKAPSDLSYWIHEKTTPSQELQLAQDAIHNLFELDWEFINSVFSDGPLPDNEDGNRSAGITLNDGTELTMRMTDTKVLTITSMLQVVSSGEIPDDIGKHLIESCRQYNADHFVPKAYPASTSSGELGIILEMNLYCPQGCSRNQLRQFVDFSVTSVQEAKQKMRLFL